jgi:phosphatidylinositol glycan class U
MRAEAVTLFGAVLRLVVFWQFPSVPLILDASVECSTPVTSFKRLQEGVFQYLHGRSPYNGGVYHQSPLLLALFSLLPSDKANHLWAANILYTVLDVVVALYLSQIAVVLNALERHKKNNEQQSTNSIDESFSPAIVAALYLFNPYTLLSTLSRSTLLFSNAAVAGAIHSAVIQKPGRAVILLALGSALSVYPIYIAPALITLANKHSQRPVLPMVVSFVVAIGMFLWISHLPTGSWDFVSSTYGVIMLLKDLTPNIGLWWYFFTEMFDFFRPFFIGVFQIYLLSFSIPISMRFASQPLFAVATILGVSAVFKSYPEAGDIGFYLSILALYKPVFRRK